MALVPIVSDTPSRSSGARRRPVASLLGVCGLLGLLVLLPVSLSSAAPVTAGADAVDADAAKSELTAAKAAALGVIEGVTEFLPISSTGHLLVSSRLMDVGTTEATKEAADTYAIVIQAGAILAVLLLYWPRVSSIVVGMLGRDLVGRRIGIATLCAFLPAAVIGLAFEDLIKGNLLEPLPVIIAWALGGVLLIWFGGRIHRRETEAAEEAGEHGARSRFRPLESITWRQGLIIGAAQVVAMWPGTSRSLVTIVAALLVGLSLSAAVEFSFILGLVTLGAATVYEGLTNGGQVVELYGLVNPVIGFVCAFVSAAIAVRWMVGYLQRHSLAIFGWYRVVVAAGAFALLATGVI